MGWFATLLLGVAGSILGGFISNLMFGTAHGAFQPAGFFFSLLGAILLLLIVRKFRRTHDRLADHRYGGDRRRVTTVSRAEWVGRSLRD
jgi:uncharacterized membrane protein YeaQ/YmgE (transglycosylase-associated protein family)